VQLVINSFGSYLHKSGNCFVVKRDDRSFEVAAGKVSSILITTAASISTDAIKLALDSNIDIVFLNSYGEPYGRSGIPGWAAQRSSEGGSWRFTMLPRASIWPGIGE